MTVLGSRTAGPRTQTVAREEIQKVIRFGTSIPAWRETCGVAGARGAAIPAGFARLRDGASEVTLGRERKRWPDRDGDDAGFLPRRGCIPEPRVAQRTLGGRGERAHPGERGAPWGRGRTRAPTSPGCAEAATLGSGVQPLRGKE